MKIGPVEIFGSNIRRHKKVAKIAQTAHNYPHMRSQFSPGASRDARWNGLPTYFVDMNL